MIKVTVTRTRHRNVETYFSRFERILMSEIADTGQAMVMAELDTPGMGLPSTAPDSPHMQTGSLLGGTSKKSSQSSASVTSSRPDKDPGRLGVPGWLEFGNRNGRQPDRPYMRTAWFKMMFGGHVRKAVERTKGRLDMGAANFGLLARRWLYDVLANDPVLQELGCMGVSEHPGPLGSQFPLITYNTDMPFMPSRNVSEEVMHATGQLRVRVNDETRSFEQLAPIAARIVELLENATNEPIPGGGWILTCRWQLDHTWLEDRTIAGAQISFRSLGAVFRLRVQAPD